MENCWDTNSYRIFPLRCVILIINNIVVIIVIISTICFIEKSKI